MKLIYAIMVLLLFTSCSSLVIQDATEFSSADLFGMIYDYHNQPCANAQIFVNENKGPASDINGRFIIPGLSKGTHEIKVLKEGFEEIIISYDFLNRTQVLYIKMYSINQLLELAEKELDNRKLVRAEAFLSRAETINPEDPVLLYYKAVLALKRDQPESALELLLKIEEQGLFEPVVMLAIADIYEYFLDDKIKAAEYLKYYLKLEENMEVSKRLEQLEVALDGGN